MAGIDIFQSIATYCGWILTKYTTKIDEYLLQVPSGKQMSPGSQSPGLLPSPMDPSTLHSKH